MREHTNEEMRVIAIASTGEPMLQFLKGTERPSPVAEVAESEISGR